MVGVYRSCTKSITPIGNAFFRILTASINALSKLMRPRPSCDGGFNISRLDCYLLVPVSAESEYRSSGLDVYGQEIYLGHVLMKNISHDCVDIPDIGEILTCKEQLFFVVLLERELSTVSASSLS